MRKVIIGNTQSEKSMHPDRLVTWSDLQQFKTEMAMTMTAVYQNNNPPAKQWLKSHEVRKLLNISPGTLQTFRQKGIIPYTRIGGIIYYESGQIHRVLKDRQRNSPD